MATVKWSQPTGLLIGSLLGGGKPCPPPVTILHSYHLPIKIIYTEPSTMFYPGKRTFHAGAVAAFPSLSLAYIVEGDIEGVGA